MTRSPEENPQQQDEHLSFNRFHLSPLQENNNRLF